MLPCSGTSSAQSKGESPRFNPSSRTIPGSSKVRPSSNPFSIIADAAALLGQSLDKWSLDSDVQHFFAPLRFFFPSPEDLLVVPAAIRQIHANVLGI